MPRNVPAGFYDNFVRDHATAILIVTENGDTLGFTDGIRDIDIDLGDGNGTVTYESSTAYVRKASEAAEDLSVDNTAFVGVLNSDGITERDLEAGVYDNAKWVWFEYSQSDLSAGQVILGSGVLGEVSYNGNSYEVEGRGLQSYLNINFMWFYQPTCLHDFGDNGNPATTGQIGCGVRIDPPEWQASTAYTKRQARDAKTGSVVKPTTQNGFHYKCTVAGTSGGTEPTWPTTAGNTVTDGTVTWEAFVALSESGTIDSVPSSRQFTTSDLTQTFGGVIVITSGSLNGKAKEIASMSIDGTSGVATITLKERFSVDLNVGDTFRAEASCDKRHPTCKSFDNIENFLGFVHVPRTDDKLKVP